MGDSYSGQAGEDSKKVVSKTATAVGHAAGALSNVPLIGPYARATEEVASRLGRWADLFGFSKPRGTHDFTDERQRHLGTMAVTNDKDMARTLTMDVKNENTIDPRTVGLSGEDEMSIPHVCGKEALITRFSWSKNHDPDHELIRIPITPYMSSTFPQEIGEVDLPPCAYVSSFFKYWRGTLQFRFMVNASNFHRGKLRFRFEPYMTNTTTQDYNVVQSEILDISEVHDHKVEIGWGADRNFLHVSKTGEPSSPEDYPDMDIHNGVLVVSVANSLTVPDDKTYDSVDILVGMNTCDDIQFSVPNDTILKRMTIMSDDYVPPDNGDGDDDDNNDDDSDGGNGEDVRNGYPITRSIFPKTDGLWAHSTFQQGAFHYGWHHDNFHHNQGYLRDKLQKAVGTPSKQFPAIPGYTRGEYDDLNGTVVKKQIQAMLKCGITFMVCSWWGPDSAGDPGLEDRQFDDYVLPQCGEYNVNQRKEVMRACLLYETTRIKQNGSYVYNTNASNQLRNEMAYIKDKHTHPTRNDNKYYLRASKRFSNTTTADSPVLFFYLLRAYSENDQKAILSDIYEIFTNVDYSGYSVEPYIIGDLMFDNPKSYDTDIQRKLGALGCYDVYGQTGGQTKGVVSKNVVRALHQKFRSYAERNQLCDMVPTVSPGYNDRGVRLNADHRALSRQISNWELGSTYKAHLRFAQESALSLSGGTTNPMVITNSWNEWHEDTNIEPCESDDPPTSHPENLTNGITYEPYGTKYLNIMGYHMYGDNYVAQSADDDVPYDEYESFEDPDVPISCASDTIVDLLNAAIKLVPVDGVPDDIDYGIELVKYYAQSEERENEHAPETTLDTTILEKPQTYHHDDSVFFGETIASLRAMLKRYTKYGVIESTQVIPAGGDYGASGEPDYTTYSADPEWVTQYLPTFPHYKSNYVKAGTEKLKETLLSRIAVLYLGKRGSTRWKALPDFRTNVPRISAVKLVDTSEFRTENANVDDVLDLGWNGVDAVTGVYNPVLEWEAPYYSNARFHIARSLERRYERGHAHTFDKTSVHSTHYMCAAGDDFQLFYFLGTPTVRYTNRHYLVTDQGGPG